MSEPTAGPTAGQQEKAQGEAHGQAPGEARENAPLAAPRQEPPVQNQPTAKVNAAPSPGGRKTGGEAVQPAGHEDLEKQPRRWSNWGDYPLLVVLSVLGTVVGIVTWFTDTPLFRGWLKNFTDPDDVSLRIDITTIVACSLLIILYILIHQNRSRARRMQLSRYGYGGVTLVWLVAIFWIVRSAPMLDPTSIGVRPVPTETSPVAAQPQPVMPTKDTSTVPVETESAGDTQKFGDVPVLISPVETARSWMSIAALQNLGSDVASIDYTLGRDGKSYSAQNKIAPGETWLVETSEVPGTPNGEYGAVVSSSQLVWAIAFQEGKGVDNPDSVLRLAYSAPMSWEKKLYFPAVKDDYYGVSSGYSIQNTDSKAVKFRARFLMEDGKEYIYYSPSLQPGESFWMSLKTAKVPPPSDDRGRLGSLIIEGDGPLVGVIVEHGSDIQDGTSIPANVYSYTAAQSSADGYTAAYVPERGLGKVISLHIVNVDSAPIDIDVTYGLSGRDPSCKPQTFEVPVEQLQPDSSILIHQKELPASVKCWAWASLTGTGKFIAYASEANSGDSPFNGLTYNARGVDKITGRMAVPFFADHYKNLNSHLNIRSASAVMPTTFTATFHCTNPNKARYTIKTKPLVIGPSGAYIFSDLSKMSDVFDTGGSFQPNSWCSVMIEGSGPLVAYVTESSESIMLNTRVNYDAMNLSGN